ASTGSPLVGTAASVSWLVLESGFYVFIRREFLRTRVPIIQHADAVFPVLIPRPTPFVCAHAQTLGNVVAPALPTMSHRFSFSRFFSTYFTKARQFHVSSFRARISAAMSVPISQQSATFAHRSRSSARSATRICFSVFSINSLHS